jgi:hypothetical protein
MKYWLGIVSKEHVIRGVEGSYVQVCHGKAAPLRRMTAHDWFIYYSPVNKFQSTEKLQKFTAIGKVKTGVVYQVEMFENFKPYRCDVDFFSECKEVPINILKADLEITKGNYGILFRRGHIELTYQDFYKIATAMGINVNKVDGL